MRAAGSPSYNRSVRKVLITGAGGFTGRHMAAELLAHRYEPVGLFAHAGEAVPPPFASAHVADLVDASAIAAVVEQVRPDLVVHLAGIPFVTHGDADALYRVNVLGTRNLLEALGRLPTRPAMTLLASSANVYGTAQAGSIDESVQPAPGNDYAVSKLAMEHMARLYADQFAIVVTRPFNYTGVGQSGQFLIPKILDHVRRRAPSIELGNLDVGRDFSDVRMVVETYRRLLECPQAAGRVVNVCSGHAVTVREVLALAREISGHEMAVTVNPALVRTSEVPVLQGSCRALEGLIGPVRDIPLRDTVRWMLEAGRDG